MTDLYGVRVLAVDLPSRRIRLRSTVVYYDTGSHAPLTDDASFFLRVFGDSAGDAPLGEVMTRDQRLDEAWVDANTRWFIESVERIATRNHPLTDEEVDELLDDEDRVSFPWEEEPRFDELPPEVAAELVLSEETNVGADYDVVVTDPRWIEHLTVGDWWRTTAYPTHADRLLPGEAAAIPDLRHPVAVLKPFSREDESRHLAFSDDGRFLAVNSEGGELVVYDATSWRECFRAHADDHFSSWLMWVPGEPVITLRHHEEARPQLAYDVVRGTPVEAPPQSGRLRSVIDPADGRSLEVIENDDIKIRSLKVSPGGDYLAISGESPGKLEVIIQRVSDHQVVTRHAIGRGWYPLQTYEMAWSPDGRWLAAHLTVVEVNSGWEPMGGETHIFRVGLPTEPAVPGPE
ncbi:WD40 repeat domain-containing protein [Streptomyces sp. NPDC054940]